MLLVPWRKATWLPCGALGLLPVKPLPLALMPEWPENVHGVPLGLYQYSGLVAGGAANGADGVSNPKSLKRLLAVPSGLTPAAREVLPVPVATSGPGTTARSAAAVTSRGASAVSTPARV